MIASGESLGCTVDWKRKVSYRSRSIGVGDDWRSRLGLEGVKAEGDGVLAGVE